MQEDTQLDNGQMKDEWKEGMWMDDVCMSRWMKGEMERSWI